MKKLFYCLSLFWCMLAFHTLQAEAYVLVTASNDADNNELLVYDAQGKLLQSIATQGQGGIPSNKTGGGIAKKDYLVAVVNFGSQSVSLFKQQGNSFMLLQVLPTLSKPVSVAFGHNHLYILGTTSVESHQVNGDRVNERPDGSSRLLMADGSAAQVGVLPNHLIISEKTHTIELVDLRNGVVTDKVHAVQLPPAPNNDTPVGLVTRGDVAYVTIAHSDKVGIVRDGRLIALVSSGSQHAPCWLALTGPWLYSSNTPSKTISRYKVTNDSIVLVEPIAATIPGGGPSDIDCDNGLLAVLDTGGETGHLTQFQIIDEGKLKFINVMSTAKTANGIAIIKLQAQQSPASLPEATGV
jgi:hypothetical protein